MPGIYGTDIETQNFAKYQIPGDIDAAPQHAWPKDVARTLRRFHKNTANLRIWIKNMGSKVICLTV